MGEKDRRASGLWAKSWFSLNGEAESSPGRAERFEIPDELARLVIERYSRPGDVVLDPYAGRGSILSIARDLGRVVLGVEQDRAQARVLAAQFETPHRIIAGEFRTGPEANIPKVDLVFTSPPNDVFGGWEEEMGFVTYWDAFDRLFERISLVLKPTGSLVIEACNQRDATSIRPFAFEAAIRLSQIFVFVEEYVRCNTDDTLAGPRSHHSHLLVFRNTRGRRRNVEDVSVGEYL